MYVTIHCIIVIIVVHGLTTMFKGYSQLSIFSSVSCVDLLQLELHIVCKITLGMAVYLPVQANMCPTHFVVRSQNNLFLQSSSMYGKTG